MLYTSGDWVRSINKKSDLWGLEASFEGRSGACQLGFSPNLLWEPSWFFSTFEGLYWDFIDKKLKYVQK